MKDAAASAPNARPGIEWEPNTDEIIDLLHRYVTAHSDQRVGLVNALDSVREVALKLRDAGSASALQTAIDAFLLAPEAWRN